MERGKAGGTVVAVRVPLRRVATRGMVGHDAVPPRRRPRVVRRGIKQVLAEESPDIEFGEAGSSGEALALIRDREWDLILLDINIPGREAWRCSRR